MMMRVLLTASFCIMSLFGGLTIQAIDVQGNNTQVVDSSDRHELKSPVGKGSWNIGGSATWTSTSVSGSENSSVLSIRPQIGKFVIDGLLISSLISLDTYSYPGNRTTFTGLGFAVGYFFNNSARKTDYKGTAFPYLQVGIVKNTQNPEFLFFGDMSSKIYVASGGTMIMLSNSIAADVGVVFQKTKVDTYEFRTVTVGVGLSAFLY